MKTRIEWRHEHRVLKLDDTSYDQFPEEDDVIEMDEAGETQKFRVAGIESAVVILEAVPEGETLTPNRETSRLRTEERLEAERNVKRKAATNSKTFRVHRSGAAGNTSKSHTLSKTAKGDRKSRAARASAKR